MSTILVTGGAGFIGSHTCVELLESGYDVVVIDNLSNACEESLKRVEKITGKTLKFYKGDIADKELMDKILTENDIYAVIHFAGLKAVGESVQKPLEYYTNNISGTLAMCDVMRKHGVKNIIFSSSATVYGDPAEIPITEKCPKGQCTNPYGWTKSMLEQILTDIQFADKELPRVNVFGNDYPTPDGTGVRDYIHVMDLATGHVNAIDKIKENPGVKVYNLGTGKGYSVLDVIKNFSEASGIDIPYVITDRRPGDIAECYSDATLAKEELGWEAKYDIKEMCADSWNWQKNNPNGYR